MYVRSYMARIHSIEVVCVHVAALMYRFYFLSLFLFSSLSILNCL